MKSCVDNNNKKYNIYNDNNSDLDKEIVEIELSSHINNAQYNCDLTAVKLELCGNILLIANVNDLKRCGKPVYKVK